MRRTCTNQYQTAHENAWERGNSNELMMPDLTVV